eukprot:8913627-Pyramimonas_sp.AAC.1
MTIVSLPLRLSAAACSPLFPNSRHSVHLRLNNKQHYQLMPGLQSEFRYRGTPHTYIMAGVMRAE